MSRSSLIFLATLAIGGLLAFYHLNSLQPAEETTAEPRIGSKQVHQSRSLPLATPAAAPTSASTPQPSVVLPSATPFSPLVNRDEVSDHGLDQLERQMNQSFVQAFLTSTGLIYSAPQQFIDQSFSKEGLNGIPTATLALEFTGDIRVQIAVSRGNKSEEFFKASALSIQESGASIQTARSHLVDGSANGLLSPFRSSDRKGVLLTFSNRGLKSHYAVIVEADISSPVNVMSYIQLLRLDPARAFASPF